jgi:hypothetical protein
MSRAVSNRFKTDNNDFLNLESNFSNFRLLLESATSAIGTTRNRERKKYPGFAGPAYE